MKAGDWATVWEELPEAASLESAFSGSFDSAPIGIEYFIFGTRVAQDDSGKGHLQKSPTVPKIPSIENAAPESVRDFNNDARFHDCLRENAPIEKRRPRT
jgi:hypothetical protein